MKERLLNNLGFVILVIVIFLYFILSYVGVDKLEIDLLKIVVDGGLLFIGSTIANSALLKQGLLSGKNNDKYKDTITAHIKQKQAIFPKLNKLQHWLDDDYASLLKIGRTVYVNSAGYDYEQVFSDGGKVVDGFKVVKPDKKEYKGFKRLFAWFLRFFRWLFGDDWKVYRERKRYIRKAKRYKITRLTVSNLTNIDDNADPNKFTSSEHAYVVKNTTLSTTMRVLLGVLFPSVTYVFYGFNLSAFLFNLMMVVIIVLTSLSAFYGAYMFIIGTARNGVIMKINKLEEFDNSVDIGKVAEKTNNELKENDYELGVPTKISAPAQSDPLEEIHREH